MFGHVKIQRDSDDHIIKVFKQSNMEIWTPFGSPMIPQWSPFSFGVLKIRKHKTDQILGNVNSWKSILPEPVRFNRPNYTAPVSATLICGGKNCECSHLARRRDPGPEAQGWEHLVRVIVLHTRPSCSAGRATIFFSFATSSTRQRERESVTRKWSSRNEYTVDLVQ